MIILPRYLGLANSSTRKLRFNLFPHHVPLDFA